MGQTVAAPLARGGPPTLDRSIGSARSVRRSHRAHDEIEGTLGESCQTARVAKFVRSCLLPAFRPVDCVGCTQRKSVADEWSGIQGQAGGMSGIGMAAGSASDGTRICSTFAFAARAPSIRPWTATLSRGIARTNNVVGKTTP